MLLADINTLRAISIRNDKKVILAKIVSYDNGLVLKLWDKTIRKKIGVNEKLIARAKLQLTENQKNPSLTLQQWVNLNEKLSSISSTNEKIQLLSSFLSCCTTEVRTMVQEYYSVGLRATLDTLSWIQYFSECYQQPNKTLRRMIAHCTLFDLYNYLARKIEIPATKKMIAPMLAHSVTIETLAARIDKEQWYVEPKYDGIRLLVAKEGSHIYCYSRNNKIFPQEDFLILIPSGLRETHHSYLLDCQLHCKNPALERFQNVSRVVRTSKIATLADLLPTLELVAFDILSYNGKSMIDTPYIERRKVLAEFESLVKVISSTAVKNSTALILEHYNDYVQLGYEGILLKQKNSLYLTSQRSYQWLKLKATEKTADLLVTGAHHGKGKYQNLLSSFQLSAKHPLTGELVKVGAVGSGLSQDQLQLLNDYWANKIPIILEVAYDYMLTTQGKEYGLRFPRVKRIREDRCEPSLLSEL